MMWMNRGTYVRMLLAGLVSSTCGAGVLFVPALALSKAAQAYSWERTEARLESVSLAAAGDGLDVVATYSYAWKGRTFEGSSVDFVLAGDSAAHRLHFEDLKAALAAGGPVEVFVDPKDPTTAVLFRQPDTALFWAILFGLMFGLPGVGLLIVGTAGLIRGQERGPAVVQGSAPPQAAVLPVNSAWTLVPTTDTWAQHAVGAVVALFWNTLTWVFVLVIGSLIARGELRGWEAVFASLFMVPFVGVGLAFLWGIVRAVRVGWRMRAGQLWVASWPLRPGQEVAARFHRGLRGARGDEVLDAIGGTFRLQEIVKYRVGTDTRTVTETARDEPLVDLQATVDRQGIQAAFKVVVPADAAPSFGAPNNRLVWTVRVVMQPRGFPQDDSEFEVLVAPGAAG